MAFVKFRPAHLTRPGFVALLCLIAAPALGNEEKSPLAPIEPIDPKQCGPTSAVPSASATNPGDIEIEADEIEVENGRMQLQGDVRIHHGPWRVDADSAHVKEEEERAEFSGAVRMQGQGVQVEAESASLHYGNDQVQVEQARYLTSGGGRGTAEQLSHTGDGIVEAQGVMYTTCELENPGWHLSAQSVRVDAKTAQGQARHAVLNLGGVPLMYLPWVGFPVGEERQSGWLVPTIGSSTDLGYSLETPYYLNLAPHYDAIMSVRYMGRRGLQFLPSGRYRTRHGGGSARIEFLADQKMDDERYLLHWQHHMQRGNWEGHATYGNVSDSEYLEDYESGVTGLSRTRLRQEGHLIFRNENLRIAAAVTGSDPLKDNMETWDRLPRIRAQGSWSWPTLGLRIEPLVAIDSFQGNLIDGTDVIEKTAADMGVDPEKMKWEVTRRILDEELMHVPVEGERYDAAIAVSRPISGPGWNVTTRLEWRHTKYHLDYAEGLVGEGSPTRTLPTLSLDARMRLERRTDDGGLQTLEPHLFYLNRPHREQSHLPRFDTRRLQPDFDAVFRHAQHSGLDRMDAADQLAVGIGTRVFDPVSNYLKFQAQLARVWYFRDPGMDVTEGDTAHSAWAAQARWKPNPQWGLSTSLRHDPNRAGSDTVWVSHQIDWRGGADQRLQLRYTRRTADYEQASGHVLLPLGDQWTLAARYHYDMRNSRGLEQMVALEHEGCCLTVGIGAWRVRRDSGTLDEDYENRILFQIRFHGLAGFGEDLPGRLRRELDGEPAWKY